jgi:hypothetical protein
MQVVDMRVMPHLDVPEAMAAPEGPVAAMEQQGKAFRVGSKQSKAATDARELLHKSCTNCRA